MSGLAYGIPVEHPNFIGVTTNEKREPVTAVPVTLTNAYTDNQNIAACGGVSELAVYIEYTPGENNAVLALKVETSPDKPDSVIEVYQDVTTSISSGIATVALSEYQFIGAVSGTTYRFRVLIPVADKHVRISVKETATTAGEATVRLLLSGRT